MFFVVPGKINYATRRVEVTILYLYFSCNEGAFTAVTPEKFLNEELTISRELKDGRRNYTT